MAITKKEFIAQHFPEYKDIDPRFDSRFVYKVTKALVDNKFYKTMTLELQNSVCNQILKMKNNFIRRKYIVKKLNERTKV